MTLGPDRRTLARLGLGGMLPLMLHPDPEKGSSGATSDNASDDEDDDEDDAEDPDDKEKPNGKPAGWNDDIQAYVSRIVAKEVRSAKKQARKDVEDEISSKKAEDDAEAERKRLEEAGEFETVKTTLISERDTARTDLQNVTTERDALKAFFDAQYTAAVNDLPDVVKAFKPADDAAFAEKKRWLETAQEQAKALGIKGTVRGSGPNPPISPNPPKDADEKVARAKRRPGYSSF